MNPSIIFNSIPEWEAYIDQYVITNGMQEITGLIGNNSFNGAVTFIKKSPLNWSKATIFSTGGSISLGDNFLGVALFLTTAPTSLTYGDNFYNQYVFINMTDSVIPLGNNQVYYNILGQPIDSIPARSAVTIMKAANDLWVAVQIFSQNSSQNEPKTFVVGTTPGAPVAGTNTWQNSDFSNKWVALIYGRSIFIDFSDVGDGGFFITKTLISDTLTIGNYTWNNGDILSYILISPSL